MFISSYLQETTKIIKSFGFSFYKCSEPPHEMRIIFVTPPSLWEKSIAKKQDLQFPIWSTLPISISFILISKNCPPVFNLCRDFHLTISHSGLRFDFAFPQLLLFSCWRLVAGRSSWKFSHELFCLLQNLSEYLPHHQPSMAEPTYQDLKWKWS